MRTIISEQQQVALLQKQGRERLNRKSLGKKLGLSAPTVRRILDDNAPVIVTGKVFTAVNDWLISELAKWQQKNSPAVHFLTLIWFKENGQMNKRNKYTGKFESPENEDFIETMSESPKQWQTAVDMVRSALDNARYEPNVIREGENWRKQTILSVISLLAESLPIAELLDSMEYGDILMQQGKVTRANHDTYLGNIMDKYVTPSDKLLAVKAALLDINKNTDIIVLEAGLNWF